MRIGEKQFWSVGNVFLKEWLNEIVFAVISYSEGSIIDVIDR